MVISREIRERIDAEMTRYPHKRGALLTALRLVQDELGHIAPETAAELAELFGLRPIDILEVVSFYNLLYDSPQPRHHVTVCTNLPCSLRGARGLLRQLEAHLGTRAGEATADGRIHLGHEECLGACGYAPMMRVDDRYHEGLDVDAAKRIVDALD
ncbi:MAG: NAD(P)H-dependent oxidoreductase subunit E [Myxococcota bacterium]